MLGFVIWTVVFSVVAGIVLFVQYWSQLIRSRDQYTRDDLVDVAQIVPAQLDRLLGTKDRITFVVALVGGVGAAWALTLFGGLVSPNVSPAPDHASSQVPNYFFQSILFPAILHLVWPSLKDAALDNGGPDGYPARLMSAEVPFMFGLTTALGAVSLTMWGVYHEMSFFFAALNLGACMAYAGYRLENASAEDDDYPEPYRETDYDSPDGLEQIPDPGPNDDY